MIHDMQAENLCPESDLTGAFTVSGSEYDDLWRCRWCRRWFVVPSLARDHEQRCEVRPDA